MVHLICLHCSRPNPSEAKFCNQCGAGLLRRFCGQCHAVNDADSHFCQRCGTALPAQPVPGASSPPPPTDVPVLTDVVAPDETGASLPPRPADLSVQTDVAADETEAPPTPASLPPLESPPALAAQALPRAQWPRRVWAAHRPVLFGFGGVAVLLVAAALWTRPLETGVQGHQADAANTGGASVAADAPAPTSAPEPPAPAAPSAAPAPMGGREAVDATAPTTPAAAKDGMAATEALSQPVAPPRPATRSEPRRPAVLSPAPSSGVPAPAHECTQQVDALGLCAPGDKIIGR